MKGLPRENSPIRAECLLPAACLCLLLALGSSPVFPADAPAGNAAGKDSSAASQQTGEAVDAQDKGKADQCNYPVAQPQIQERSQELVRSWSCHTFRWFDSWWGDQYDFDEKAVNGLLTVGAEYRQYDGFNPRLRLKVRAPLPNLSHRWDLIVGRVDEQAYISDTQAQDQTFYNPGVVDRGQEAAWLLGLGHRGNRGRSGWDYSLGVHLRLSPNPYAKAQYFYNKQFSENTDLRFRQTVFWRRDQGVGTTSRGDLATGINPTNVLRWEGIATVSEATKGTEWYFGQTWYHLFGERNAISLLGFARGETGAPVPLKEYGAKLIWRRPFTREWLYLSVGPSITWPREKLQEHRDMSLGFGVWLEMEFGRWHY